MNYTKAETLPEKNAALVQDWLNRNRPNIERYLLAGLALDMPFFNQAREHLCWRKHQLKAVWTDDFSTAANNAIYRVIYDYTTLWQSAPDTGKQPLRPLTPPMLDAWLRGFASAGQLIQTAEIPGAVEVFESALRDTSLEIRQFLPACFPQWLLSARTAHQLRESMTTGGFKEATGLELQKLHQSLTASSRPIEMYAFGAGIDVAEPITQRMPTGFIPLDLATGDGLALGESTLIIAPPGSGKTILTCQLGCNYGLAGIPTLIISTEETHRQLEPRIISAHCGVPISAIKDFVNPMAFAPDQLQRYLSLRQELSKSPFRIVEWDKEEEGMEGQMERILDEFEKTVGVPPQVVLLDWLGGALGAQASNDKDVRRLILKRAADYMANLAKKRHIITVGCAQASRNQCTDKVRVDATMLADCKTLDELMTNVWGLTILLDKEGNKNDGKDGPVYSRDQYIHVSKSRRGIDTKIPVRRDFLYQRFVPQGRG